MSASHSHLDHCKRMYEFEDHHHNKIIRNSLKFLGLWPYKKTKFEHFRAIFILMLLISHVIVQLGQLAIVDFTINAIIRILSNALPSLLCVVKFNFFFFNTKNLKQILQEINNRMLPDPQEIKMAEYYARQGKNVTLIAIWAFVFAISAFLMLGLIPDILDFFQPLNESRTHYLIFLNEYHVNEGIQFYYFFLYSFISISIGGFTSLFVSLMILVIALHCCLIFKVCSYRIQHSVDKKIIACSNQRNIIVERIIRTVELHQNAQRIFKLLMSSFTVSFLMILVIGTFSFAINLYRLWYAIINMDNLTDLLTAMSYIIIHQFYLFSSTFWGQQMVNHADELFNAIYMSLWYETSVTVQKLFLFMMQISSKSITPNVGGVYLSVMETFTSVMSTIISFLMVIYAVQ